MSQSDRLYVQVYAHLRDRVERRWVGAGALNSFVNRKLAEALNEGPMATREDVAALSDAVLSVMMARTTDFLRAGECDGDQPLEDGEMYFALWMVAEEAAIRLVRRTSIWSWMRGKK